MQRPSAASLVVLFFAASADAQWLKDLVGHELRMKAPAGGRYTLVPESGDMKAVRT